MSTDPKLLTELHELVDALREQDLSDSQAARLELLINQDVELRRLYIQLMDLTTCLHWRFTVAEDDASRPAATREKLAHGAGARLPAAAKPTMLPNLGLPNLGLPNLGLPNVGLPNVGFLTDLTDRTVHFLSSPRSLATLVAGSLVTYFLAMVVYLAVSHRWQGETPAVQVNSGLGVARISAEGNCRWSNPSFAATLGSSLSSGELALASGLVEITFESGARVVVEGPAELELESSRQGFLRRGRIVAHVPPQAVGFLIRTPRADIIDLGTEFGAEVDDAGNVSVHVLKGSVAFKRRAVADPSATTRLSAGEAIRITASPESVKGVAETESFARLLEDVEQFRPFEAPIPLGNLFDDSIHTPLEMAVASDIPQASAFFGALGVSRIQQGGAARFALSPKVRFDFKNLGWTNDWWGSITNDAWTDKSNATGDDAFIRTSSRDGEPESGIGMHANAAITFDLAQIRRAGRLGEMPLRFVCDRGGLNFDRSAQSSSTFHLIVLVSGVDGVEAGYLNGHAARLSRDKDCWFFTGPIPTPLGGERTFVEFDVPLPAKARFLTLAAASADGRVGGEHTVWSGARLELNP